MPLHGHLLPRDFETARLASPAHGDLELKRGYLVGVKLKEANFASANLTQVRWEARTFLERIDDMTNYRVIGSG